MNGRRKTVISNFLDNYGVTDWRTQGGFTRARKTFRIKDVEVRTSLVTTWGRPDLWLFFPGCGIDVAKAVEKVRPKRVVFGHLWELGHGHGRLNAPLLKRALPLARRFCDDVSIRYWGDRVM